MYETSLFERLQKKSAVLGVNQPYVGLVASIPEQKLYLFVDGTRVKDYVMSSSKSSPSCVENSLGTPWGLHEVCEKIGSNAVSGMVFKGRKPTGKKYCEYSKEDQKNNLITSRIFRLRGLEYGVNAGGNKDTFSRYVYIHGTNHEEAIGSPTSSGCLQLKNLDVIELFDSVPVGTFLFIENGQDP
jgi:hypothetical protein